ncbi:hypothetical protein F1880_005923 [Penicillium rolfsii]|nr:hypothetical protein F1880_005923 [Penicillium rolfsii]
MKNGQNRTKTSPTTPEQYSAADIERHKADIYESLFPKGSTSGPVKKKKDSNDLPEQAPNLDEIVTASVVGIVVPALHISRLLLKDLRSIKDAPDTIKTLTDNIDSLTMALTSVESIDDNEWRSLGPALIDNAKATITTSTATCERFSANVQKWTKRSHDGSLSLLDQCVVGFFKQQRLTSMSEEIKTCQTKITSVVSIATLLKLIKQGQVTDEIRQRIDATSGELVKASQQAAKETSEIENKLKVFSFGGASGDDGYEDAISQFKEQQKALEDSQKLLGELLSQLKESAGTGTSAGNNSIGSVTFGDNNSGVQLGLSAAPLYFTAK